MQPCCPHVCRRLTHRHADGDVPVLHTACTLISHTHARFCTHGERAPWLRTAAGARPVCGLRDTPRGLCLARPRKTIWGKERIPWWSVRGPRGHPHVHTHDTHTHVHTRTRRCVCTRSRGELRRAGQLLSAAGAHPHPAPPPRRRLLYLNHDSIGIIVFETDNWLLCISPVLHVYGFNN